MKGFSVIEIIISISLLIALTVIAVPFFRTFGQANDLVVAVDIVLQSINQAQTKARVSEGDSAWGIHLQVGRVIMFKGADFAARDPSADALYLLPAGITFAGLTDVVFSKFTGLPQTTGQIVITNAINDFETLTINEQGAVSY